MPLTNVRCWDLDRMDKVISNARSKIVTSKRTSNWSVGVKYCNYHGTRPLIRRLSSLPFGLVEMASSLGFIGGKDDVWYKKEG